MVRNKNKPQRFSLLFFVFLAVASCERSELAGKESIEKLSDNRYAINESETSIVLPSGYEVFISLEDGGEIVNVVNGSKDAGPGLSFRTQTVAKKTKISANFSEGERNVVWQDIDGDLLFDQKIIYKKGVIVSKSKVILSEMKLDGEN